MVRALHAPAPGLARAGVPNGQASTVVSVELCILENDLPGDQVNSRLLEAFGQGVNVNEVSHGAGFLRQIKFGVVGNTTFVVFEVDDEGVDAVLLREVNVFL